MKVLFLDIDGVLNSFESAQINKSYEVLIPRTLEYIKKIHDAGVKIVISSSWRIIYTLDSIAGFIKVPCFGATPVLNNKCRGDEIQSWLDIRDIDKFDKYAIIDDNSDMLDEQLPFFVQTDPMIGMQEKDFNKLKVILEI